MTIARGERWRNRRSGRVVVVTWANGEKVGYRYVAGDSLFSDALERGATCRPVGCFLASFFPMRVMEAPDAA